LFDLERGNIEAGQAWAANHATSDDQATQLCSDYPNSGMYCLSLRQHPRERIRWREAGLAAARSLKNRGAEGAHLCNLGIAYRQLGEHRRAIDYYEQQLKIEREIRHRLGEGSALRCLGVAYHSLGENRRAIDYHEQALVIDREVADRRRESADLGNLGN